MRLRLDPADEYMHPLERAKNFNESMYFNVFDPLSRLGAFFRIGNRPKEGARRGDDVYLPARRIGGGRPRPEA